MKQTQALTGLNEQELLGLCAQLIGSSTVVAAKVIFRPWIDLKGRKKNNNNNNYTIRSQTPEGDLSICPLQ